jgi:hypothetical protein
MFGKCVGQWRNLIEVERESRRMSSLRVHESDYDLARCSTAIDLPLPRLPAGDHVGQTELDRTFIFKTRISIKRKHSTSSTLQKRLR